jgi:hypothetical protein
VAYVVSHQPVTAKPNVQSHVNLCGICNGQSGTGTGFPPSTSLFHCQYHSASAPYLLIQLLQTLCNCVN